MNRYLILEGKVLYISSKRGGLKFVTMNDSETFYMINAIPYINNIEIEPLEKISSYYVKKFLSRFIILAI